MAVFDFQKLSRVAIFRSGLAIVLFADVAHLWIYRAVFPSLATTHDVWLIFAIWVASLLTMVFGYKTKSSTAFNYLLCMLMFGVLAPAMGFDQGAGDSIALTLSLLATVFAWLPSAKVAGTILPLYLSEVYLDAGIHKLLSPMWRAGSGFTTPLTLPSLVWIHTAWLSWFPAVLLRATGWAVIAFELWFPVLYFLRRTRIFALMAGVGMHVGIILFYPIPIFSGLMLVPYVALLPGYRERIAWPREKKILGLAGALVMVAVLNFYLAKSVPLRGLGFALRSARRATFVLTGLSGHGVFADELFQRYNYQLRLIANGEPEPYSRGNQLAIGVRDRTWENWWKKTQGPWVRLPRAEANLEIWASLYWPKANDIEIEARPQVVDMRAADTSLFSINDRIPWRRVGMIRFSASGKRELAWDHPSRGDADLGSYMTRVLRGQASNVSKMGTFRLAFRSALNAHIIV